MHLTERLASLLAPTACLICASEGDILCHQCRNSALPPAPGRCYLCLSGINNGAICRSCLSTVPLAAAWARCAYTGTAKQLVHDLKFSHRRGYAQALARAMADALPALPTNTIVTHVPTAPRRKRERSYDQAALLAKALAQYRHLPYAPLLERVGNVRQVGTGRTGRREQLQGVFRPLRPYMINGDSILLVDDILTTGGTLEAAASVLQQSGAASVWAAVFAQAV